MSVDSAVRICYVVAIAVLCAVIFDALVALLVSLFIIAACNFVGGFIAAATGGDR